ncbi:MAG: acyltransferase [Lachnospiraceae bacterium]|nr:acyltransferase [Lachnospiraceae bacterium]
MLEKNDMNKRKTSIELMRFLGSAMVVFVHCRGFLYPDSPLAQFAFPIVDFFFMVTGYFTMSDASKAITMQKDGSSSSKSRFLPEAADTIRYVWHKAKDIFVLYIFALILAFVIRTAQKDVFSMSETLQELFHFKWEFLMLHMLGFNHAPAFNVDYLLGPGWFISSMMIALVPFYFFARRFGKTFSGVIAPISMVLIYAFIIQSYNTLDVGNEVAFGMIMVGNLRAFAGLAVGALAFHLNEHVAKKLKERKDTVFFGVTDIISWVMAVSLFVFPAGVLPDADMVFWMVAFMFLLLNGLNDAGPISRFLNHHGSKLWGKLGKLSMYIYLLHMPVILIWQKHVHLDSPVIGSILIFAIAAVFSAAVMFIQERIRSGKKA